MVTGVNNTKTSAEYQDYQAKKQDKQKKADNGVVNTLKDKNGLSYTTGVQKDGLSNDDFLKIMLAEMKMQDPTKPMDSKSIMDGQMKMATIDANKKMAASMLKLQQAYANSSLSTAANMIGKIVENGEMNKETGLIRSFKVKTVENKNGELFVNVKELVGLKDNLVEVKDDKAKTISYDKNGYILDDGKRTSVRIKMTPKGLFQKDAKGNLTLLDDSDKVIKDKDIINKYKYNGTEVVYADDTTTFPLSKILKVR
jgi:flagellar basal-body rod modification protein FlgD